MGSILISLSMAVPLFRSTKPFNNDETIRIHSILPMCQCRKGTSRPIHRLVAHR